MILAPNAPAHERAKERAAAAASGCSEVGGASRPGARRYVCGDGWGAAQLLAELGELDAQDANVRALAASLWAASTSARDFVENVARLVRGNVAFAREAGELFTAPAELFRVGVGDCDCHARTVYALLRAGGLPAALGLLHRGGGPTHVAAVTPVVPGGWVETTIAARLGEHPMDAAVRLGLVQERDDLAREVRIMVPKSLRVGPRLVAAAQRALRALGYPVPEDGVGLDPATRAAAAAVQRGAGLTADGLIGTATLGALGITDGAPGGSLTADLSDAFLRGVGELARSHGWRPADLLLVMSSESNIKASAMHPRGAAVGITQFSTVGTPSVLTGLGWRGTPAEFARLSAEAQLPFVERFFAGKAHLDGAGAELLYADNWLPASAQQAVREGRARDPSYVVAARDGQRWGRSTRSGVTRANEGWFYDDNVGLDVTRDGRTTLADLRTYLETKAATPRWREAVARLDALGGGGGGPVAGGASGGAGGLGTALLGAGLLTGAALAAGAYMSDKS